MGSAKALIAGELRMVTSYFRSGRSDAATSRSTVLSIVRLQPGVLVDAAIGGEDALVLALRRRLASPLPAACGSCSETCAVSGVLVQAASNSASASAMPRAPLAVVVPQP